MRKLSPYVFGAVLFGLLFTVTGCDQQVRNLNESLTLKQRDNIPYGTEAANELLAEAFPGAKIYYDNNYPGFWDSIRTTSYNQAVFLMSKDFEAARYELDRLVEFAANGNYVFIIGKTFSGDTRRLFRFSYEQDGYGLSNKDSMWMRLDPSTFQTTGDFIFPGKRYESWFTAIDTSYTRVLGYDRFNRPNFLAFKKGSGGIFIHSSPMAFSNYFILHKNNYRYFENVLSVIPSDVGNILWNEYYLGKRQPEKKPHWLSVLFQYRPFKWGLLTALLTLALYVLLASRRSQRMIPPHERPKNDSLDFVRTMGRLYHEKRDHHDLARKMSVYYLEHIRTVYKLPTHTLDEQFIQGLHFKSGYSVGEIRKIVAFIGQLDTMTQVSEEELSRFYRQLELFYQKT